VTYDELVALARRAEGHVLETVTGRRFTVGVYLDCPYFTPESSGLGRSDGRPAAERFARRFTETGSLVPADYAKATRNASYFIGLVRWGMAQESEAQPRSRPSPGTKRPVREA
jgi:hypothetical protein